MSTAPDNDPMDALLRQMFAADAAARPAPDVTARVLRRIRRHQRARRMLLLGAGGAGLAAAAAASPDLAALLQAGATRVAAALQTDALAGAPLLLALAAAAWALVLAEDGP
jgi:hypothetical protein